MSGVRWQRVSLVFRKELLEALRDRRSLMAMFGVPLLVYPLMMLGMGFLVQLGARKLAEEPSQIVVQGAESLPGLDEAIARSPGELEISVTPPEPAEALREGVIDALVTISPDEGGGVTVEIQLDESKSRSAVAETRIRELLADLEAERVGDSFEEHGLARNLANPIEITLADVARPGAMGGKLLGTMVPAMLLISAALGGFYPAVGAITREREVGLAEVLFVAPITRTELLLGKVGLVTLAALLTALLNLVSMGLVASKIGSSLTEGTSITLEPARVALAYLAAMPAVLLLASAVLLVATMARTYQEAGHYSTPVMLLGSLPAFVVLAEPDLTLHLAAVPIVGTALVMRDVLMGEEGVLLPALVSAASTLVLAALVVRWAAALYSPDHLEGGGWTALKPAALASRARSEQYVAPSLGEALGLFLIVLVLFFYVAPTVTDVGLVQSLATTQLLAIALPTLAYAALYGRWMPRLLALRLPRLGGAVGGLLIGIGAPAITIPSLVVLEKILPAPIAEAAEMYLPMTEAILARPWLMIPLLSLLPAVCEELLFRGVILSGLRSHMNVHSAVVLGGILFAAAHLDLQGMVPRTLLGIALGYLFVYTGSIVPSMLLHAANNATALVLAVVVESTGSGSEVTDLLTLPGVSTYLAIGVICVVAGALLAARKGRPATNEAAEHSR